MRSLTIQIPTPCHERWDDMLPAEQGRFCASCLKTVVDYTNYSDQDLVRVLRKVPDTACGRFLDEQLNRPLVPPKPGAAVWRHLIGLMTMGLFGWQTAKAQSQHEAKPVQAVSARPSFFVSSIPTHKADDSNTELVINGQVMLADSANNLSASSGTTVSVYELGVSRGWLTQTDSSGKFQLTVPIGVLAQRSPARDLFTLHVNVFGSDRHRASTTIDVKPTTSSVTVENLILYPTVLRESVTGGGICTIPAPSRWQKLKRSLFR